MTPSQNPVETFTAVVSSTSSPRSGITDVNNVDLVLLVAQSRNVPRRIIGGRCGIRPSDVPVVLVQFRGLRLSLIGGGEARLPRRASTSDPGLNLPLRHDFRGYSSSRSNDTVPQGVAVQISGPPLPRGSWCMLGKAPFPSRHDLEGG